MSPVAATLDLEPFFDRMPELFRQAHDPDGDYQELLYNVEHDFVPAHLERIDGFLGLPEPRWTDEARAQAIALLDGARYPDTAFLDRLRPTPGLTLAHCAGYLHFFHHVYVPFDADTCAGLRRLGFDVPFTRQRDSATYGAYTRAVEDLKEAAPYWAFPERNLSLQRVVQAALCAYGAED